MLIRNTEEFSVNIGGILVRIRGKRLNNLKENYRGFISNRRYVHSVLNCRKPVSSNAVGKVQQKGRRNRYFLYKDILFFDQRLKEANLFLPRDNKGRWIDLALRTVYSKLFWHKKGLLLHCAGIIKDNRAYLFIGPSGAGKTTVVKKSKNFSLLSDDMVGIRKVGKEFIAVATPWGSYQGEFLQTNKLSSPIGFIYFLKKDKKMFLRKISPAKAIVMVLLQNSIFCLKKRAIDSEIRLIFSLLDNFFRLYPSWQMHSYKKANFWPYLEKEVSFNDRKKARKK